MYVRDPLKIVRGPAWFCEIQIKYQWFKRGYNANQIHYFGLRRYKKTRKWGGCGNFLGTEGLGLGAAHPLNLVPKRRALLYPNCPCLFA
jgi:hypothetical protein